MKITDTTDFFSFLYRLLALFFLRLCAFLLSSSSKKRKKFIRCFAIIICLTWCCRCFFRHIIDCICRCVCVCNVHGKQKHFLFRKRKERERESLHLGISLECTGTSSRTHRKHFKCKALNFQVYFAPFVWKVVEQIFYLFFHFFHFGDFRHMNLPLFQGSFLHSKNKKRVPHEKKDINMSMVRHYNAQL